MLVMRSAIKNTLGELRTVDLPWLVCSMVLLVGLSAVAVYYYPLPLLDYTSLAELVLRFYACETFLIIGAVCIAAAAWYWWLNRRNRPWVIAPSLLVLGLFLFGCSLVRLEGPSKHRFTVVSAGCFVIDEETGDGIVTAFNEELAAQIKVRIGPDSRIDLVERLPAQAIIREKDQERLRIRAKAVSKIENAHAVIYGVLQPDTQTGQKVTANLTLGSDLGKWPHTELAIRRSQVYEPETITVSENDDRLNDVANTVGDLVLALAEAQRGEIDKAIKILTENRSREAQFFRAIFLHGKAERSLGSPKQHLDEAISTYKKIASPFFKKSPAPGDTPPDSLAFVSLVNVGVALKDLARSTDLDVSIKKLREAEKAFNKAFERNGRQKRRDDKWGSLTQEEWQALIQNDLGIVSERLARMNWGKDAVSLLGSAEDALEEALEVRTKEKSPEGWAATQSNLGIVYKNLAILGNPERAGDYFRKAHDAYAKALHVREDGTCAACRAATENNLGNLFLAWAKRSAPKEARKKLKKAVGLYNRALSGRDVRDYPAYWATTMNNLGSAYLELGKLTKTRQGESYTNKAVETYEQALDKRKEIGAPIPVASTQVNLANALIQQAKEQRHAEQVTKLIEEAIRLYQSALQVFGRNVAPTKWAGIVDNWGMALLEYAKLRLPPKDEKSLPIPTGVSLNGSRRPRNNDGTAESNRTARESEGIRHKVLRLQKEVGGTALASSLSVCLAAVDVFAEHQSSPKWAEVRIHLADILTEMNGQRKVKGKQALEVTKDIYENVLEDLGEDDTLAALHATIHTKLGFVYKELATKEKPANRKKLSGDIVDPLNETATERKPDRSQKWFERAEESLKKALDIRDRGSSPLKWAESTIRLGDVYREWSKRSEGDNVKSRLYEAERLYEAGLEELKTLPRQEWDAKMGLANAKKDLAPYEEGIASQEKLREARKIFDSVFENDKLKATTDRWYFGYCKNSHGIFLKNIALRSKRSDAKKYLEKATRYYREAREVREDYPYHRIATSNNLGNALVELAKRSRRDDAIKYLEQAKGIFDEVKRARGRPSDAEKLSETQNSVGNRLLEVAKLSHGRQAAESALEAEKAYQAALKKRPKEKRPNKWAETKRNLARVYLLKSGLHEGQEAADCLEKSSHHAEEALKTFKETGNLRSRALTERIIGQIKKAKGAREGGDTGRKSLQEAEEALKKAIEHLSDKRSPEDYMAIRLDLANVALERARLTEGDETSRQLEAAERKYKELLRQLNATGHPLLTAKAKHNLALAMKLRSIRDPKPEHAIDLLEKAVGEYGRAFRTFTRLGYRHEASIAAYHCGEAYLELSKRDVGDKTKWLEKAGQQYETSLKELKSLGRTKSTLFQSVQKSKRWVERTLGARKPTAEVKPLNLKHVLHNDLLHVTYSTIMATQGCPRCSVCDFILSRGPVEARCEKCPPAILSVQISYVS